MNARALMKLHWVLAAGLFITTADIFFDITAAAYAVGPDSKVAPFAPARGHYAKLAELEPHRANPDLPIDAERWMTNPKSIERIEQIQPEFVKVPLDTFILPLCPANSSKQTQGEIDYLLRLQANRTQAEGERALYFAPWGYCPTTKHCPTIKSSCPEFASQHNSCQTTARCYSRWHDQQGSLHCCQHRCGNFEGLAKRAS